VDDRNGCHHITAALVPLAKSTRVEPACDGGPMTPLSADHLYKRFGKAFANENDAGGMSIAKDMLAEFRAMTAKTVVWDRGEKCWRRRARGDGSGRLADGT
jgi:hypothetical protein